MPLNPNSYNSLFIDENQLKQNGIINENVDFKLLTPTIKQIQDNYIMRTLGTNLFVDLQNKIAATASGNTNALNSDEKFLLNAYISPVMVWGVMKEAPLVLTYKYTNKGIQKASSDNSESASLSELQALQDKASKSFDWYNQRLMEYLWVNQQLYPAYAQTKSADDRPPSTRGYRSSIYLGSKWEQSAAADSYGNPLWYFR